MAHDLAMGPLLALKNTKTGDLSVASDLKTSNNAQWEPGFLVEFEICS